MKIYIYIYVDLLTTFAYIVLFSLVV